MGGSENYNGFKFEFHHGSEHTVEGKRHDLEMQTIHVPLDTDRADASGIRYAAVSVMFSVKDYTAKLTPRQYRIVDAFFDSLDWDVMEEDTSSDPANQPAQDADGKRNLRDVKIKNPIVPKVNYGEVMMLFDTDRKWVYEGSQTTPPCATTVYWNVLRTVYPIK